MKAAAGQEFINEFISNLDQADGIEEEFLILETAMATLGFNGVAFTFIPEEISAQLSGVSTKSFVSQRNGLELSCYFNHYAEQRYGQHDYVINQALQGNLAPMNWWGELELANMTPSEAMLARVARSDFGVTNGLSIPTFCHQGNLAGVSLSSLEPDHLFKLLYADNFIWAKRLSLIYTQRVLRQKELRSYFLSPLLNQLSQTEKRVLYGLSVGKAMQEIAGELNLSYKYLANKVLDNLRIKLGCVSRDQLLYRAGKLDISGGHS